METLNESPTKSPAELLDRTLDLDESMPAAFSIVFRNIFDTISMLNSEGNESN